MKYGVLFSLLAVLFANAALVHGGWLLLLLWPALSLAVVAAGYFHFGPRVFGKSKRGLLSPINQLLPREYPFHQLTENIMIGRRLLPGELPDKIDHVIDLTSEFNEPSKLRSASYHSFQILDGSGPAPEQLRQWAARVADLSGKIYIHCAEGHGRTGLFAAVLLVRIGHSQTVDDALQFIQSKRPLVRLGKRQLAVLQKAQDAA